jgi:hypothetical protein
MARGTVQPDEIELRHYRWLTPVLASLIDPLAARIIREPDVSIGLAFYIVNFAFSTVSCVVLFALLRVMQFPPLVSMIGVCAFAASRVTVLVTATPMVDAAYFCAIAVLLYLTVANRKRSLALSMPLLVLSKETIFPFLLLPLLTMRRSAMLWSALAISIATYAFSSYLVGVAYHSSALPVVPTAVDHLPNVAGSGRALFTLSGIHDLQSGFSLWLPMAALGAWLNSRYRYREMPAAVIGTVPIAFILALLSGNSGRMFFACYPAVIAYALIVIEHVTTLRPESS